MMQARCPGCGGDVAFKRDGSLCVVCSYCNAVVARGDRTVEQLGKVGDLVDTQSPLELGLSGKVGDQHFELVGRAQMLHPAGGVWDEWYASFSDGRWGWLAEAQGRFYLLFQQPLPAEPPPFDSLAPGAPAYLDLVVAEKAVAQTGSARGELPWRLTPNEPFAYADLSGPGGTFATLDYSFEPPAFFAGNEVTLDDIGLGKAKARETEARTVKGVEVRCPQCGGPLELRAPDKSQRVTCPSCSSLLDCSQGKLAYLKTLQKYEPWLQIGAQGDLAGHRWQIIGFLQRSVEYEGVRYFWDEYLLYESHTGFRWLVCADGHWSFVEPIAAGDVSEAFRYAKARGIAFRRFQDGVARVDYVMGEFYWRIDAGDQTKTADYVAPPLMLSREGDESEVNWSIGTYTPVKDVERAFNVTNLPKPTGIAPNQPYPHKGIGRVWMLMLLATWIGGCAMLGSRHTKTIYQNAFELETPQGPVAQQTQTVFSDPFELEGHKNIRIKVSAPVNNTWAYVEGDLIEENTGLVQTFAAPIEYYSGRDSDGAWSEGDAAPEVFLSALPAGQYTLRMEVQWEKQSQMLPLTVRIDQGVPRYSHLALALLGISLIPILLIFGRIRFEMRRWSQSDYSPYQSSS